MTTRKARVSRPVNGLIRLSIIERLESAERYYRQHDARFADGLRHAAEIAAPDGWQLIAPAWTKPKTMRESKAKVNKNALRRRRFEPAQLPTLFAPEHVEKSRKLFNDGVGYYDAGKVDEAIERWTCAIAANPNNAYAYNNRSIAYSDKGMMDDAERDYKKAIELGVEK